MATHVLPPRLARLPAHPHPTLPTPPPPFPAPAYPHSDLAVAAVQALLHRAAEFLSGSLAPQLAAAAAGGEGAAVRGGQIALMQRAPASCQLNGAACNDIRISLRLPTPSCPPTLSTLTPGAAARGGGAAWRRWRACLGALPRRRRRRGRARRQPRRARLRAGQRGARRPGCGALLGWRSCFLFCVWTAFGLGGQPENTQPGLTAKPSPHSLAQCRRAWAPCSAACSRS
jgi:hypothetical protein